MTWSRSAQYISDILALLLIIRFASIRVSLPRVYRLFGFFLGFQLLESLISLALDAFRGHVDYRLIWMSLRVVAWVLSLWMVYALVSELLQALPGILRFSRLLLNIVFSLAVLAALLTVVPEYTAAGAAHFKDPIDRALVTFYVLDRAVSMAAFLVLVCILAFVLWFPVQMRRNLAVFSVGLVAYFGARVGISLLRTYWLRDYSHLLITVITWILPLCYLYWIFLISSQGQAAEVRPGHSWRLDEQRRLMAQLESMNTALLRAATRR